MFDFIKGLTAIGCLPFIIAIVLSFFTAWLFMFLLNWIVPLFGWDFHITYWQTFGLMLLINIIGSYFRK